MPLLPGEILNHRYRIVSLLAEGAYGAVYRAWDERDERDYAIKEYLDTSAAVQKRFRAEARRLSRLQHPQLATVRDYFTLEESGQYLISDYIDGVDLQSLLEQYGSLPPDLISSWLQAACQPLTYLHEQKQLHLNIKPANIRLAAVGEVFLVDSGLPGLGIRPAASGYGSPEQQAQAEVDAASDIYSLGATLYTLLTGQVPPNALGRESGLVELKPARELNPDVAPYLSIVATRAMSLRPDTRYESAVDFARALEPPIGRPAPQITTPRRTSPLQAATPPPPRLPPSRRKQIEQRTIVALSGFLVLLIVLIFAFGRLNLGSAADIEEPLATATFQSAIVAALTDIAPSPTPTLEPTTTPTPTPEPLISKTGARMIFVPGGVFLMGNDEGEPEEQPAHLVELAPYYIDETEVTNGRYALCVEAGVCNPPRRASATTHPVYYGDPAYDDYPVIFVSWYDAVTFCEWRDARLPSEAEWEKAASFDSEQGIKLRYPWGDAFDGAKLNFCDANCPRDKGGQAWNDGHEDTAPVGSYSNGRSPLGLYDMAGNVMEWISDWYEPRYYRQSPDVNPLGPVEGAFKALRGGSWLSGPDEVATTVRGSYDPTVARANLGFRCAANP